MAFPIGSTRGRVVLPSVPAYHLGPMDEKEPLRLVVIGDSTSFTDEAGPQLPTVPHLYPNVARALLEEALERPVTVNVIARAGMHVREAHRALTKDRHVMFEVLMGADAVIVGVGSIDHAPAGFPAVLEAAVPYVRPAWLRHRARRALRDLHPYAARLLGSRVMHTPAGDFERLYDGLLLQVRALARGAAGAVVGPTSHRSRYYGGAHPGFAAREGAQLRIAARHGFPAVASWPIVEPAADRLNRDGIHWPADVHAAVGHAVADVLIAQLRDGAPRPPVPAWPG